MDEEEAAPWNMMEEEEGAPWDVLDEEGESHHHQQQQQQHEGRVDFGGSTGNIPDDPHARVNDISQMPPSLNDQVRHKTLRRFVTCQVPMSAVVWCGFQPTPAMSSI